MLEQDRPQIFDFEVKSSENFWFIPLSVRFHLDWAGMRISLEDWQRLPYEARVELSSFAVPASLTGHAPARGGDASFAARLFNTMVEFAGHEPEVGVPPPVMPGDEPGGVPEAVVHQFQLARVPVPDATRWGQLGLFQRYALAKLSRKRTANHDFVPAITEFGLANAS